MRIVLIHAVAVAMAPVHAAFQEQWPEAECVNLLDDSLSPDRARDGDLTEAMSERIRTLADYAVGTGADGILFTCSAFGPAIEAVARTLPIPVLKPNEAMFEAALAQGRRIGMLATFQPSVGSMEEEFRVEAGQRAIEASIETICVPEAMAALRRGDAETHNRLLAQAAPSLAGCDAVMLAHFSTARAAAAVGKALGRAVLTSPDAAVAKLRPLLDG
jgi:Asp/Glu/hydantoin racemase